MIIQCEKCIMYYDDQFRLTICPHNTFNANDGQNNFRHYPESWHHVQMPSENEAKIYPEFLDANRIKVNDKNENS